MFGCLGDVDGDSVVGVSDVLHLSSFGCQTECGVSDLNGDGQQTHLTLIMLSMFGTICF